MYLCTHKYTQIYLKQNFMKQYLFFWNMSLLTFPFLIWSVPFKKHYFQSTRLTSLSIEGVEKHYIQ